MMRSDVNAKDFQIYIEFTNIMEIHLDFDYNYCLSGLARYFIYE